MSCSSCGDSSCGGGSSCGNCSDSCNSCHGPKVIITKQGLTGEQGEQGLEGPQGPAGSDGSIIAVEDEGVSLTADVKKINFVGAGVTATEPLTDEITVTIPGSAGGEVNTASNIGAGTGIFSSKVGVELEMKTLTSTGGTVVITNTANTVNVEAPLSGTQDYLARWTPSGTQLGVGTVRDNGVTAGINIDPASTPSVQFYVNAPLAQDRITVINAVNSKVSGTPRSIFAQQFIDETSSNGTGVIGQVVNPSNVTITGNAVGVEGTANTNSAHPIATTIGAGSSTGGFFSANGNEGVHYGVVSQAQSSVTPNATGIHIGGFFRASDANENYAIQLQDGSEQAGTGKILGNTSNDGKATWVSRYGTNQQTVSTTTNIPDGDENSYCYFVDTTAGDVTINLPPVTLPAHTPGRTFVFKKVLGANNVIIDGSGAETIDGIATFTLSTLQEAVTVQSDGTQWHVVGKYL
jgi:hypothetical protein